MLFRSDVSARTWTIFEHVSGMVDDASSCAQVDIITEMMLTAIVDFALAVVEPHPPFRRMQLLLPPHLHRAEQYSIRIDD